MEEIKKKNKVNNIFAFLALSLMLIGLPAGSWYYLQSGLNYQIDARKELQDHGKVTPFSFQSQKGQPLTLEDIEGSFSVATFLNADDKSAQDHYFGILSKLHEQFDQRPDVLFLTHLWSNIADENTLLENISREYNLTDEEQIYLLTSEKEKLEQQAKQGYRLLLNNTAFAKNHYVALVDTVGTIVNYYDFNEQDEVRRLVEHIAMLIPKEIIKKPEVRVEAEK